MAKKKAVEMPVGQASQPLQAAEPLEPVGQASSAGAGAPVARVTGHEACPTFTLYADSPGYLRALIAAAPELPPLSEDRRAAFEAVRAFDLWEERQR